MSTNEKFELDDLTTPVSREQVQAKLYQVLAALGVNTSLWKPGSVVRTMIVGNALVLAALSKLQSQIARMGFLPLAEAQWLTLVARYVYGVERREATRATGEIILTNNGGGVFALDVDDLVVRNPTSGMTYRNAAPIALGSVGSPTAIVTVPVLATEYGAASTSAPGYVTQFTTPLLRVNVTNATALVGLDAEDDATLRVRCSEKLGALSPFGPWDAYNTAARNAKRADGSLLGVTRIRTVRDGYGNVTTYLASASGKVDGELGDLTTDLGAADEAIQKLAAPLAVTAFTRSAVEKQVAVQYEIWLYATSGRSTDQIKDAVNAHLVSFFATRPIGGDVIGDSDGNLYRETIRTAIVSALPEIFRCDLTAPAATVSLLPYEVATFAGAADAIGVHQVSPPEGLLVA